MHIYYCSILAFIVHRRAVATIKVRRIETRNRSRRTELIHLHAPVSGRKVERLFSLSRGRKVSRIYRNAVVRRNRYYNFACRHMYIYIYIYIYIFEEQFF